MREINTNCCVKVKINDLGYKILEDYYDNLLKSLNDGYLKTTSNGTLTLPEEFYDINKHPKSDENGYVEFPFWYLMRIFGAHMIDGEKSPFESDILIKENDLCEHIEKKKNKKKALINKGEQNN